MIKHEREVDYNWLFSKLFETLDKKICKTIMIDE